MFHQPGMSVDCAYHNRFPQLKAETMQGLDFVFAPTSWDCSTENTHMKMTLGKKCRMAAVFIYCHGQSEQEQQIAQSHADLQA